MTHYVLLSNFGNYHFSDPVLSLPLLIFLEYIKAKSTPFHPHIVLYEPLSDKGFLFNHLTIITPKQSSVIPLISPTMLLFFLLLLLLCFETANMIGSLQHHPISFTTTSTRLTEAKTHSTTGPCLPAPLCPPHSHSGTLSQFLNSILSPSPFSAHSGFPLFELPVPLLSLSAPFHPSGLSSKIPSSLSRPPVGCFVLPLNNVHVFHTTHHKV